MEGLSAGRGPSRGRRGGAGAKSATRGPRRPPEIEAAPSPYVDAEIYDLLFEPYREDHGFYLGLARAARGPVLDLACGTGRILLPMLAAGVDAEGLDAAPAMLAELERKAALRGLAAVAHLGDMRSFQLPRKFALIVSPFNAFVHNTTLEDQLGTLRACREHLTPGGQLAFDVQTMNPAAMVDPDGIRVKELETPYPDLGFSLRLFDTRSKDLVEQLQHSLIEIEEVDDRGAVTARHRFESTARWIQKNEMELLLELAGFDRWTIASDLDGDPLDENSLQMVVQAWTR